MKSAQTYLTDEEFEALARVESALNVAPGKGRPSGTPARNVKESLALCVRVADWILATGMQPPQDVVERNGRLGLIEHLRYEKKLTLAEIGEQLGISRQRIHQILGNSGNGYKSERIREAIDAHPDMSHSEVAAVAGVGYHTVAMYRDGRFPIKGDSPLAVGYKWEQWAAERLEESGFVVELMPHHSKFDILVNGNIRIDVKACSRPSKPPSMRLRNALWRFQLGGDHQDKCDFLFCVTGERDVFIIPVGETPKQASYIAFSYPSLRPTLGRYQKYFGRYDLIQSAIEASQ